MASTGVGKREQKLPEVPLGWADFSWSLEKLRHRSYSKRTTERDWFRINPLEIVLLGCQTLSTGTSTQRDHGTMVLVMECIEEQMRFRPRYWKRLLAVLIRTCQSDIPPLIIQRCVSALIGLWKSFQNVPEFRPALYSWGVCEMNILSFFEWLLKDRKDALGLQLTSEVNLLLGEIRETITASKDAMKKLNPESERSIGHIVVPVIQSTLQDCNSTHITPVELALQKCDASLQVRVSKESLQQLAEVLKTVSNDLPFCLTEVISIVELLSSRWKEVSKQEPTSSSYELVTCNTTHRTNDSRPSTPDDLLAGLTAALTTWSSMHESPNIAHQHSTSRGDVASTLLSLTHVILSSASLDVTLPIAADFFSNTVSTLMIYATEGYLSNSASAFFLEVTEYVSSLVEQGISPTQVVQTYLPNLFGPMFGTRNHAVSCKLLEYGYLAACSQHQKSLLSEGLSFLVKVFNLFPPIDKARIQLTAHQKRIETMKIVCSLMDELIASALQVSDRECGKSEFMRQDSAATASVNASSDNTIEGGGEVEMGEVGVGEEGMSEEGVVEKGMADDGSMGEEGMGEKGISEEGMGEKGISEEGMSEERDDDLSDISVADREADTKSRIQILLQLLELACAMVRNGDNISYLFASVLPKLFSKPAPAVMPNRSKLSKFFGEEPPPPFSDIPLQVDKKTFAIHLLRLATLSLEHDMASPFQICGVVAPKLIQNLDKLEFSDEEKMAITIEIIDVTYESLKCGHNITELISHGIDLITSLLPSLASPQELREFIGQMVRQFVTTSLSSLLFVVKQSFHFMMKQCPEERAAIQELFKTLVTRGKRDEIRGVFRLCRDELQLDKYAAARRSLYSYSTGVINHRQLIALCDIILALMDVQKPHQVARVSGAVEGEEEEEKEEEGKKRRAEVALVMEKLSEPCLSRLITSLTNNRFRKQEWEVMSAELSRIALFRTLFSDEFSAFTTLSATELMLIFQSKFPPDVLSDEPMMQLLAVSAARIEHMQVPRYQCLKSLLSKSLQHFLTLDTHEIPSPDTALDTGSMQGARDLLEQRMSLLENYLLHTFPRNCSDRKKLIECGYSERLWEKRLSVVVETDGSHSLDENMRQTLLACYREFADILKQMAITHLPVDGELVKSNELFSDELSLVELKGRRAIAVRAIDVRAKEGYFHEKKISLLAKEDKIEEDFEKQAMAPVKPKKFSVALNTRFFDCARCCGAQIIGCYAPTGEHCERPLEIGIRSDSAIASIYDELGVEIENAEVLFTPEGAYMFKAYSNGHPYDTSQVWVGLLTVLLSEEASLVPAVIIPNSYPNQGTWDTIRRSISTELTGGILTCQHDFSPEWRTYYDHRPEKVRNGVDVVLHPGFSLTQDPSRPAITRQRSRMAKDLAGMMFDHVMQDLLQDEWWKQFRFLGKYISQYLSEGVERGQLRDDIIVDGFDYERWKNNFRRLKNVPLIPQSLCVTGSLPSKTELVAALADHITTSLKRWSTHTLADVSVLCTNNHRQFLELKGMVEKSKGSLTYLKEKLPCIRGCLKKCTFIVPLLSLSDSLQEEIIHWIFRNEDRVWRYRGGRDGRETLQQFMSFLGRRNCDERCVKEVERGRRRGRDDKVFAGVVAFCVPSTLNNEDSIPDTFRVANMIGYAVGEILQPSSEQSEKREEREEREEGEERELSEEGVESEERDAESARWGPHYDNRGTCYEVVTAWVHPSYRGLNIGVQLYLDIAVQVPTSLVMCDMLEGSVERIVRSNGLLRLLERLHILSFILHYRQRSYSAANQEGVSEQFEQVVFSVWPVRAAVRLRTLAVWVKGHSSAAVVILPPLAVFGLMAFRRLSV